MGIYVPNPSDAAAPLDSDFALMAAGELRSLKARINALVAAAALPIVPSTNQSGLTQLLYPSRDGQWRDIYRSGWRPAGFNQQWGGAQIGFELNDGATDALYKFNAATGYVEDTSITNLTNAAAATSVSQGFKVVDAASLQAIWVKIAKIGNPANSLQLKIVADDGTGTKPLNTVAIANGTATAVAGKVIGSKTDGDWYRFVFAVAPVLVAGTQYHILLNSSGAVDAVNYWTLKSSSTGKYPHGNICNGDAANVFTAVAATDICFLVESTTASQFLQNTGQFDYSLKFAEGASSQLSQSKALVQPLRNFFDGKNFTALHRVSALVKGKPIADYIYGVDHDRLILQCNTVTGFASILFYDSARTLVTLTGNTDVSAAGIQDIAVVGRFEGDVQDFLQLWVNGVKQAETTLATYVVDKNMRDLGTCWLGGGFSSGAVATPVWTQDMQMATLPSAQGWTWTGTGAEANCMSIQGGKLFQNKNGYGNLDTGFYAKNTVFVNATGWAVLFKSRVLSNVGTSGNVSKFITVADGTKILSLMIAENFLQQIQGTVFTVHGDFKSAENVFLITGKGSDYYVYMNGKLIIDGTGLLVTASALNTIQFGDTSATAAENADAIWSAIKYYQGGMVIPTIPSAALLHEYAHWSGNKSTLLPTLYAAGAPLSVKTVCGMSRNYVETIEYVEQRRGVISSPAIAAGAVDVLVPDMEAFIIGDTIDATYSNDSLNSTAASIITDTVYVDGRSLDSKTLTSGAANSQVMSAFDLRFNLFLGLHKIEGKHKQGGGTPFAYLTQRILKLRNTK